MLDHQRATATLPTEADARIWEIETRATAALPLLEVLDAARGELRRRLADPGGDDDATLEFLGLILEDALHDLRAGTLGVRAPVGSGGSGR